jgi:hypothetical protein
MLGQHTPKLINHQGAKSSTPIAAKFAAEHEIIDLGSSKETYQVKNTYYK